VTIVFIQADVYPNIRVKFTVIGAAPSLYWLGDIHTPEPLSVRFVSLNPTKIVQRLWEEEISSVKGVDMGWLTTILSTIDPKRELCQRWDKNM
jgi:hypothetical protein